MDSCSKRIFPEISQPQQRPESHAPHTALQGTLLCIDPIGKYPLMPAQVKGFVFIGIVSFLEYRNIICTAFVQICVLIAVHRIHLKPHHLKIPAGNLAGFSQIFDIRLFPALPYQNQDFFEPGSCNRLHFLLNFLISKLRPLNFIAAVKSTVNAVIFTIIGNINRCKHIHGISKMLPRLLLCKLRHFFQERSCRRGEQGPKVLWRTNIVR